MVEFGPQQSRRQCEANIERVGRVGSCVMGVQWEDGEKYVGVRVWGECVCE